MLHGSLTVGELLVILAYVNQIHGPLQGIGDTLVTSLLCEALGRGSPPIVAVPCLKMDLVRHPIFSKSIALLRECGVHVLHEPERYPSPLMVPWNEILAMTGQPFTGRHVPDDP